MTGFNGMGVAFYVSAFLIGMSCIIYTFIQNRTDKLQKRFFIAMLIIIVINTITETIEALVTPIRLTNPVYVTLLSQCKYFYFVFHTIVLPLLGYYVLSITGRLHRFKKIQNTIFLIPVGLVELLMLTNPIHHFCYYYDNINFDYHREWGVTVLYVISAFYIFFFIFNIFRAWKAITKKRKIALGYFLTMVILGIVTQMLFINARVELFAEALAFLGVLLTIEEESDLLDSDVGIYNRRALEIDFSNLILNKQKFHLICIKIENVDIIRRVTGSSNIDILSKLIFEELKEYIQRYYIYQTSPDTFVLTYIKGNHESALDLVSRLNERFKQNWTCQNVEVVFKATIMMAELPNEIDNMEDAFNMIDCTLPNVHKDVIVGQDDLSFILRRRDVESAIQRGLRNNGFEVYYQPTFYAHDLSPFGAEALIRLHDEKMGNLFPDEFIPIAEQIGLIDDIDEYVLKSVCQFISSGLIENLGIESINVNLSVLHVIKPNFVEKIIEIFDESGIDRSKVNFELTESVDANVHETMANIIKEFEDSGFKVYLDDYGTGYANVQALFNMNFNVIKIDKSILWGAEKSEVGRVLLENNIRMLKQMHMKILVEGVETIEHVELLQNLGVDYFQGFFFSKPIPKDAFINLLLNY